MIEVSWSEGTQTVVYRRYSTFFEFQVSFVLSYTVAPHQHELYVHVSCYNLTMKGVSLSSTVYMSTCIHHQHVYLLPYTVHVLWRMYTMFLELLFLYSLF